MQKATKTIKSLGSIIINKEIAEGIKLKYLNKLYNFLIQRRMYIREINKAFPGKY
ncbi:hypothetical protein UT300019_10270 [Clostridium sp. CTA-19]